MTVLRIVLAALAVFRLTRLVVADDITLRPRTWIVHQLDRAGHSKAAELFDCPWCASFWVAIPVTVAAYHLDGAWFDAPAIVLGCSAVAGLLASWE